MDNSSLMRALVAGGVLAGLGIALFLVLYMGIFASQPDGQRLLLSLVLPPVGMAIVIGVFLLRRR